jgi:hypothetical protein
MRGGQRAVLLLTAVLAGTAPLLACQLGIEGRSRMVDAGFIFEDVAFSSVRLGGALTPGDLVRVQRVARAELERAFTGLRIRVSASRDARYHVRVVQRVLDERMAWPVNVAGQSRAMAGFGGGGVVNFDLLANGAIAYAPEALDRPALVDAIGRGVGRAAVHEFTHQFLPRAPIHQSRNKASYEYYAAGRAEQYFGEMRWDLAGALLKERFAQ